MVWIWIIDLLLKLLLYYYLLRYKELIKNLIKQHINEWMSEWIMFRLSLCLNICNFPGFLGFIIINMLTCKMSLLLPPSDSFTGGKNLRPFRSFRNHTLKYCCSSPSAWNWRSWTTVDLEKWWAGSFLGRLMIGTCVIVGNNDQKDEDLGKAKSLVVSVAIKCLLFVLRVGGEGMVASCWLGSFWVARVLDAWKIWALGQRHSAVHGGYKDWTAYSPAVHTEQSRFLQVWFLIC